MSYSIIGRYDIFGRPLSAAFGADAAPCPAPLAPSCPSPAALAQMQYAQPMGADWSNPQWQAFQMALASRGSAAVVDQPPTQAREQYLGFTRPTPTGTPPVDIPAGATVTVFAQPQQVFKAHRLVIPSDFAGFVLVNDIKVGNRSQLVSTGGVLPGRMFSEFSTDEVINFDTAQISQLITLTVTNIATSDLPVFVAGLKGIAVM